MPLHHYLPATFLARFSLDYQEADRRKRKIFIGNKEDKKVFSTSAGKAGAINNLYSVSDEKLDPQMIDGMWEGYESKLNIALNDLINRKVDAKTWIRILVPFVTCMMLRGPDFHERLSRRLNSLGFDESSPFNNEENSNLNRPMEIQRLLSPVTVAKWVIARKTGKEKLITNDLGFCRFIHPIFNEVGMAIPLGGNHILLVIPRTEGEVLRFSDGEWIPNIIYTKLPLDNHITLNKVMASKAQRFIFCPNNKLAVKYLRHNEYAPRPIEPAEIGFIFGTDAMAHEFTWHRLAIALEDPLNIKDDFPLEWQKLTNGWYPRITLPTNLVEFPSALSKEGKSINAHFYNPDSYLILSRVIEYANSGLYERVLEGSLEGLGHADSEELIEKFHLIRSDAFVEMGKIPLALNEINTILENNPKNLNARIKRSAIYILGNQLDSAHSDIQFILNKNPHSEVALVHLGNYYLKKKDFDQAIVETTNAINVLPKSSLFGVANFYRGLAYASKAETFRAINDFDIAIDYIDDKAILSVCYFYRAIAYGELLEKSKKLIESQILSKHEKISDEEQSIQDSVENIDHFKNKIIQDLSDCLENNPPDDFLIKAYEIRGQFLFDTGNLDLAYEDFIQAIKIENNNPKYLFYLGQIFMLKGNFCDAIDYFTKAIKQNPNFGEAHSNLGIIYFLEAHIEKAFEQINHAISIFEYTPASGTPLRYLSLIHLYNQDINLAIETLKSAKEAEPNSQHNIFVNGLIEIYKENYHSALMHLRKFGSEEPYKKISDAFKSIPLALLGKENEAQKKFKNNFFDIDEVSKKTYLIYLKNLTDFFPEKEICLSIFNELINNENTCSG